MKKFLTSTTLLTVSIFVFSGCMASSYNEMLKDKSVDKKSYTVKMDYEDLYIQSLPIIEECYESGLLTAAITSQGYISTKSKEANIQIYLIGGLGKQYHHLINLKEIDNETTNLTIRSYFGEERIDILKKEITKECSCNCSK